MSHQTLGRITVLVNDYDTAIDYYTNTLNFKLIENSPLTEQDDKGRKKRWVVVAPPGSNCQLLLARAVNEAEINSVGFQTGGRVAFFLYTDNFTEDYELYKKNGVEFMESEPRDEPYGKVIVFRDGLGNLWDLLSSV